MSDMLLENKKYIDTNNYAVSSGVVISCMEEDYARGYIDIVDKSLNSYGYVHGGAFFTLADTVAAFAARTDGRSYVTEQSNMHFISNVKEGRVTAEGKVINRGKTFCLIDVRIFSEDGKLLYDGSFNYYCISK